MGKVKVLVALQILVLVVFDITILLDVCEQVLWDNWRFIPTWVSYALLAMVFFLTWKVQRSVRLPALSLLFSSLLTALILFDLLVRNFENRHLWLFSADLSILSLDQVFFAGVLFCLGIAATCGAILGARIFSIGITFFGLITFSTISTSMILNYPDASLLDAQLNCFSIPLLWVRILASKRPEYSISAFRKLGIFENSFLVIVLVMGLSFFTFAGIEVLQNPLNSNKKYDYKVTDEFMSMLLVSEDPSFAYHHGVDFRRIKNALQELIEFGEYRRGGSTLSMQLAKVKYLSHEKTIYRKLRQICLAIWLEAMASKEQIAWAYINSVPYGEGTVGLRQASEHFFKIAPSKLSAQQSLQLVLSIYDPTTYNPNIPSMPNVVRNRSFVIRSRGRRLRSRLEEQFSAFRFIEAP